ncbi:hypothetical protein M2408_000916 [Sphingobacterium sp. BIGb0165]|nr:hypothetical protein [Sphingobacterium sp. BIGb0165]
MNALEGSDQARNMKDKFFAIVDLYPSSDRIWVICRDEIEQEIILTSENNYSGFHK